MFAKNLKMVMDERNMTQTQLAALTGIAKSGISQYLSGKTTPKTAVLQKLADALETSVDFLMGDNPTMDTDANGEPLKKVTVEAAAKALGKSEQFVRVSLQRGSAPFGFATKVSGEKWSYHISPRKLNEYMGRVIEA